MAAKQTSARLDLDDVSLLTCYKCKDLGGDKWVKCGFCANHAHTKCVYLTGVKTENIQHVNWLCDPCYKDLSYLKKFKCEMEEFKNDLKEMTSKADKIMEKVDTKLDAILEFGDKMDEAAGNLLSSAERCADSAESATLPQWSEVLKKKKKTKKNLLVVRGTDESPASDVKNELSQALEGIQISDTRFTSDGKIVMNFEDETVRNEAAQKITNVERLSVKTPNKLKPKLTLCNVHKEEAEEQIKDIIIERNEYLQSIPEIQSKIEILFSKQAAGGTIHYILRCDPMVREAIHQHNDIIKLEWGVYQVRDRYHAIICYHCQRYGHIEANCT